VTAGEPTPPPNPGPRVGRSVQSTHTQGVGISHLWNLEPLQESHEVVVVSAQEEDFLHAASSRQHHELVLQTEGFVTLQVLRIGQINHDALERRAYHLVVGKAERGADLEVFSPHRERLVAVRRVPLERGLARSQHEHIPRPRIRLVGIRAQRKLRLVLFENARYGWVLQVPELAIASIQLLALVRDQLDCTPGRAIRPVAVCGPVVGVLVNRS
jgi:hypothetical protein